MELILGAVTGLIFGVLLQKAEVLRFERQVGLLILQDATVLKFMLSAILVGAVGIHLCLERGMIEPQIKSANLVPVIVGGVLFGVGWAIAGFCPATAVGAIGEGRLHAMWAVLGMLTGAGIYAAVDPHLNHRYMKLCDYGKATLPELLEFNHWMVIGALALVILVLFALFEKK